jgi:phosphoribosylformimino-5-aminoimidazole carboxamide ribotide isomerase
MLVIPAIDIIDNKVVRLTKGDYNTSKIYSDNPIDLVDKFIQHGIKRIHIVDLEASKLGSFTCLNLLSRIKTNYKIEIEFGGGIRSINDIKTLSDIGIDYFILGSISVKNENEVSEMIKLFDKNRFIFAADVLNNEIKISGWTEASNISIEDYISKWVENGISNFLCTDISKDGMLIGPNFNLYKSIMKKFPKVDLIASGGISGLNDLIELEKNKIKYAVVGKAFYEGKISLEEMSKFAK